MGPLLEIEGLDVEFDTAHGKLKAVEDFSLTVDYKDFLGIVGESGSGKSVAMLGMLGLLPWTAAISSKKLLFMGKDISRISARRRRRLLGRDICVIFQDPGSSLNPCFTVGVQLTEVIRRNHKLNRRECREKAIELLSQVGISSPEERLKAYPHQLSGGMNQRVMIAIAVAPKPKLLIADEPSTALDVTIQAQILDLLRQLHDEFDMSVILITHDIAVVAETAKRVVVQYAGSVVEEQGIDDLIGKPRHPYTQALMSALPEMSTEVSRRLKTIPGVVPGQFDRPTGCMFSPRCDYVRDLCRKKVPERGGAEVAHARCHYPLDLPKRGKTK